MIERVSPGVREDLVLGRAMLGRGGTEARDHRPALAGIDEDVPEETPLDLRGGREAARLDSGRIEAPDPAVGVDCGEQARRGAHHGEQPLVLHPQLRLEPLVVEGECHCRRHALDQLQYRWWSSWSSAAIRRPSRSTTVIA